KNSGAHAYGGFSIAERIPGQTHSRSKIILVWDKQRLAEGWSAVKLGLHAGCATISLTRSSGEFMPQADRKRQTARQLDVVLDKPTEKVLLVAELRIDDLAKDLARRPCHEISHAWEVNRSHVVPVVSGIREIVLKNTAKLIGMRSPHVAE